MLPEHIEPNTGEFAPGEVFLRSAHNYDRDAASIQSGLACCDDSLAQQQFLEDADINTIVRRFGITGKLPEGVRLPSYGDFQGLSDYRQALDAIEAANVSFAAMPADVRSRFQNDPAQFVAFCSDDKNHAEAKALGLVVNGPPVAPAPPPPGGSPVPPPPAPAQ